MTESPIPAARPVPVLFVDLDGTVRHGVDQCGKFVNGPGDVRVFPEAADELLRWRLGGGRVVAVTNQGGIALGYTTMEEVQLALFETARQVGNTIDVVRFCQHHPAADVLGSQRCSCRKPAPGMLADGARELGALHPGEVYPASWALMVGDRSEDRGAAEAYGIRFLDAAAWRRGRGRLPVLAPDPASVAAALTLPRLATGAAVTAPGR